MEDLQVEHFEEFQALCRAFPYHVLPFLGVNLHHHFSLDKFQAVNATFLLSLIALSL